MAKFAVYRGHEWVNDIHADTVEEAEAKAKAQDPSVTHVELVSEGESER